MRRSMRPRRKPSTARVQRATRTTRPCRTGGASGLNSELLTCCLILEQRGIGQSLLPVARLIPPHPSPLPEGCAFPTIPLLPPAIPKGLCPPAQGCEQRATLDRKSTRLNSSHLGI